MKVQRIAGSALPQGGNEAQTLCFDTENDGKLATRRQDTGELEYIGSQFMSKLKTVSTVTSAQGQSKQSSVGYPQAIGKYFLVINGSISCTGKCLADLNVLFNGVIVKNIQYKNENASTGSFSISAIIDIADLDNDDIALEIDNEPGDVGTVSIKDITATFTLATEL